MKITLEQAYELATKGPLTLDFANQLASIIGGNGDILVLNVGGDIRRPKDSRRLDATLLAHAFNVLPEVVAALREATDFVCCRIAPDDPLWDRLSTAISRASTVKVP